MAQSPLAFAVMKVKQVCFLIFVGLCPLDWLELTYAYAQAKQIPSQILIHAHNVYKCKQTMEEAAALRFLNGTLEQEVCKTNAPCIRIFCLSQKKIVMNAIAGDVGWYHVSCELAPFLRTVSECQHHLFVDSD